MSQLPSLTDRKTIAALKKAGFVEDRQKGSHLVLVHPQTKARTVIPIHPWRDIKKPLILSIINDAKLTVDEFLLLL